MRMSRFAPTKSLGRIWDDTGVADLFAFVASRDQDVSRLKPVLRADGFRTDPELDS
jgi:hypothetical protein